jgi:peptidoglycan DL-endopeptidase CwlO
VTEGGRLGGAPADVRGANIFDKRRQASAFLVLAAAVLLAAGSASADPSQIESKQAQARDVLAQIHALDADVEQAVERYNLANVQLERIEADLKSNARHLVIARTGLKNARSHLAKRLVSIYVDGADASAVEVLLGAESLEDLTDRLDTIERVGSQDARVVGEVRKLKRETEARKLRLQRARVQQRQVVADRAAERRSIEGQLASRQQLFSSIKSEIAQLEEAERRRAAQLAAQARARLAQQRALAAQTQADQAATLGAPEIAAIGGESEAVGGAVAPAPPSRYGGVVGIAMQYLGTPYVWGGASPAGFDCSGFSMYVYAQVGVSLPHHAASQYGMGVPVSYSDLQAGDLVFFNGLGHMGIYVGGGSFIHAPHTGDVVKISSLNDSWYASTYVGARRIL